MKTTVTSDKLKEVFLYYEYIRIFIMCVSFNVISLEK